MLFSSLVEAWILSEGRDLICVFNAISPVPLEQCPACVFVEYMEGRKGEGRSNFSKLMSLPRGYITHRGGEENTLEAFSYPYRKNSIMCPHQPQDG